MHVTVILMLALLKVIISPTLNGQQHKVRERL